MAFKRRRFPQIVRMRLESDKDVGMMVASEAVNGKCRFVGAAALVAAAILHVAKNDTPNPSSVPPAQVVEDGA